MAALGEHPFSLHPLVFNEEAVRPHDERVAQRGVGAEASVIDAAQNADVLSFITILKSLYFDLVLDSRSTSHVKTPDIFLFNEYFSKSGVSEIPKFLEFVGKK